MLKIDASAVSRQLQQVHKEITAKLEKAVEQWAVQVVSDMADLTPIGDDSTPSRQAQYQRRYMNTGLIPMPGIAEGSTQLSLDGNLIDRQVLGAANAVAQARKTITGYKLGQRIYIGNAAPYFSELEEGWSSQAPFGIIKPTVQQIRVMYGKYITDYYKSY